MAKKLIKGRHHSAIKAARQANKHYLKNRAVKRRIHDLAKKLIATCKEKNLEKAKELLHKVYKAWDKAAKQRIVHPNTAARKKSHLAKLVAATFTPPT